MADDWTEDERRGWAINSAREEIKSLRGQARRCRARFPASSHYYQPGVWVAEAYDAAADALQEYVDSLPN